jgi:hypothetical protein
MCAFLPYRVPGGNGSNGSRADTVRRVACLAAYGLVSKEARNSAMRSSTA